MHKAAELVGYILPVPLLSVYDSLGKNQQPILLAILVLVLTKRTEILNFESSTGRNLKR